MNVIDRLRKDLKEAMKDKNEVKKRVLRMLMSAVKNFEVSSGKAVSDEEFDAIVKKQIKEREEAMQDYKRGGRDDLYEEEKMERDILKEFAKPELSDEEIEKVVDEKAHELGVKSKKEFGKLMGAVMKSLKGKASGDRVRKAVEEFLNDEKR